jgi:hypothetical protein
MEYINKYFKYKNKYLEYKKKYLLKGGTRDASDGNIKFLVSKNTNGQAEGFGLQTKDSTTYYVGLWKEDNILKVLEIVKDKADLRIIYGSSSMVYTGDIVGSNNLEINNNHNSLFERLVRINDIGQDFILLRTEYGNIKRHGWGTMVYSNLRAYKGYWENDEAKKKITKDKEIEFFGTLVLVEPGNIYSYYNGDIDGNGMRHGYGKIKYDEGLEFDIEFDYHKYFGLWVNDERQGYGEMTFKNKRNVGKDIRYTGNWKQNKMHGKGNLYNSKDESKDENKNEIYDGNMVCNKRHGLGTITYDKGFYFGKMVDDKMQGEGKIYLKDGGVYHGKFRDNKLLRSTITYAHSRKLDDGTHVEFDITKGTMIMPKGSEKGWHLYSKKCTTLEKCKDNDNNERFRNAGNATIKCNWKTPIQDICDPNFFGYPNKCDVCSDLFNQPFIYDDRLASATATPTVVASVSVPTSTLLYVPGSAISSVPASAST